MTARTRRSHKLGQSLIEFALLAPLLLLVVMGTTDFARAYQYSIQTAGAARGGMRMAVQGDRFDVGDAVRSEAHPQIFNDPATWGATGPGGVDATGCASGLTCGDTTGCDASVFIPPRLACFAVRTCTFVVGTTQPQQCQSYGSWGARPPSGAQLGIEVRVVYGFVPSTPVLGGLLGAQQRLFAANSVIGPQLY